MFLLGVPLNFGGLNRQELPGVNGNKQFVQKVTVVLEGPMFAHGSSAKFSLVRDGVGVVGDIYVRGNVSSECDKLLGFGKASAVVYAYVCGPGGAEAHDGSGKFATSTAICLATEVTTNVKTIRFVLAVAVLQECGVSGGRLGVVVFVGEPGSSRCE